MHFFSIFAGKKKYKIKERKDKTNGKILQTQAENDKDNIKLFERDVLSYYRRINWNKEGKMDASGLKQPTIINKIWRFEDGIELFDIITKIILK